MAMNKTECAYCAKEMTIDAALQGGKQNTPTGEPCCAKCAQLIADGREDEIE